MHRHSLPIQTVCFLSRSKIKFYTFITMGPHDFEGDRLELCLRGPCELCGCSLSGFPPESWYLAPLGPGPLPGVSSRCTFPFRGRLPGAELPNRSVVPVRRLVLSNYSLSEKLQPQGTMQPFFPVISLVSALVFLVIRKVIAVISHAP